jgi:large subunit ribosomal protein L29
MKNNEFKDMDTASLQKELATARGELQQQRFDIATMKLTKVHTVKQTRKRIAQLLTELSKKAKTE